MKYVVVAQVLVVLTIVLAASRVAEAQVLTPPPRVTPRPPQPPQARGVRSLQADTTLFGGYDRNLTNALQAPGVPFSLDNYRGQGAASLQYSIGSRGGQTLNVGGGADVMTRTTTATTTSASGNPGATYGFNGTAGFSTPMGSSTNIFLSSNASRNPYYSMGVFGSLPPGTSYLPDASPVNGIFDGYLWSLMSSAGISKNWARRTGSTLNYYYQQSLYKGGTQQNTEYAVHSVSATVNQQISQMIGLHVGYNIADRSGNQTGLQYDDRTQGFTVGVSATHPISQSRTLSIRVNGGANQINSSSGHYWQPTYSGTLGVDIGRTWVASATYFQTSYFLSSPLSAPDSYLSQSLMFSVGGNLSNNVNLVLTTGASQGEVAAVNSITGTSGDYSGLVSGGQLSFGLAAGWSARISLNYYKSELSGAAKQFVPTTGAFERASVWAGVTWSGRLYESPRSERPGRGR